MRFAALLVLVSEASMLVKDLARLAVFASAVLARCGGLPRAWSGAGFRCREEEAGRGSR